MAGTMVQLEPMSDDDVRAFLERAIPRRAERFVARGIWTPGRAQEASREIYRRRFPGGRAPPSERLCHIVAASGPGRVGEVWYSVEELGGVVQFWVEWIWVDPLHRRRGYARGALSSLEEEARRIGAPRMGLDVWLDNPGAVRLYETLGYGPIRMSLVKTVAAKE
jgi:GNAT superfamily N-acetyltransferase